MSIMLSLASFFEIHYILAYIILFLASWAETIVGLGFFIRGEPVFLIAAILAGTGNLNIWIVSVAAVVGGLLGDSTSYFIGRYWGHSVAMKVFKKGNRYLSLKFYRKGKKFFHSHGKKSIFLGRFAGPISCITPFIAGVMHIKYKSFLKYDIPATIIGIMQFILVGYFLGYSYYLFLPQIKRFLFYALVVLVAIAVYIILRKSKLMKKIDLGILTKLFRRS